MKPHRYDDQLVLGKLFSSALQQYADREIVYTDKVRTNYAGLYERVTALAHGLREMGVSAGQTVAVLDWDSHRFLECFFAVPMSGLTLHHVNIRLAPEQILYTVNHADDDVIMVHEDFVPILRAIAPRFNRARRIILLSDRPPGITVDLDAPIDNSTLETDYESLLAQGRVGAADFNFPKLDEYTRATAFYTTGTTGDPKGVYYSHRQIVVHTLAVTAALGTASHQGRFHRDDVYMPITPMFHVHAWGIPYVATLMGVKQVYPGRYEPERLLTLIDKEKVTFSHCVPTILHMLLTHQLAETIDLSAWKVVIGGSAMPRGLAKRALDLGIDVFSGYGMSETGPVLTLAQLDLAHLSESEDQQLNRRCMTGRAVPLVEMEIVDEDMNPLPHDGRQSGEIVARAPWLTVGYLKNDAGSDELWRGGMLHTGDMACMESDGFAKITDRIKDVIKSGGEWISSLDLESVVSAHEAVAETAAVGVSDKKWGERPAMLVLPSDREHPPEIEQLRDLIQVEIDAGNLSKWAMPQHIACVDEIPKTSVGKIDKKRIRESLQKQLSPSTKS